MLGEAADSLPIGVRMRRPVALGGGGNPFTANQRLAVTPQRELWPVHLARQLARDWYTCAPPSSKLV